MGILTRRQGDQYVITSDQTGHEPQSKRARFRPSNTYQVWTGASWSTDIADAMNFDTIDQADDYVRANYAQVSQNPVV